MIAITKGMLALSALLSAGMVTAIDAVTGANAPAPAPVAARFPAPSETFKPVTFTAAAPARAIVDSKTARPRPASCAAQEWPYLSQRCLAAADGAPLRTVSRIVSVERRAAPTAAQPTAFAALANVPGGTAAE